jgi:tRNA threonylcarbamoyladenosine biosynthesis protein TsaB
LCCVVQPARTRSTSDHAAERRGAGVLHPFMHILAFDTCTLIGSAAVVIDGEVMAEVSALVRATHGETLLPHLERVLASAGLGLSEIDVFAVGIGPGSFTGVRIGLATAKGLALAENKPIVGVTSLRTLARGIMGGAGLRVPVLDAHKGEVYTAAYEVDAHGELSERIPPFHAPPADAAAALLRAAQQEPLWLAGGGIERYGDAFWQPLSALARRAPKLCDVPRAACLAHEAARILASEGPSDLAMLEPLYLRPSDAKLPARPTS